MEFLARLFDTSDFPARWHCGNWSAGHGWLHILSDLGVWSAYLAIPMVLIYFIVRRKDLPFRKIFLLFGAFILACGTTHLMEAIIFWWPAYRLAGVIKLLTAVVSWATVVALVPVVPRVLAMRSPEELQREVEGRKQAEQALQSANDDLERRIHARTAELAAANGKLAQERERFRTTLACIGDGVIATDTFGRVTFLNSMAQTLTGWNDDQALGEPLDVVFEIVNERTRQPVENPARRALSDGTIVGMANHTILIGKDGTDRSIDDSASPIRDAAGTIVGAVLVFRDVSDKRRADDALRDSEQKFRLLADTIPQLAWVARPDGHIVWYNRRWHEYTGTTPEQMQDRGWQSLHDPQELPKVLERWQASLASGTPFEMVFPLRGADGTFRPFLTLVAPLRGEDGNILQWFGTNTDITQRRQLEDDLRKVATNLSEADRRKSEFLAVLAHELRNPLAPITTALELMRIGDSSEEEIQSIREMMSRQIQQMVHLIDDLLDVSRINSGKIVLRKERLDLSEVVGSALEASRPLIDGARHEFALSLAPGPLEVEGDRTRLSQVLCNLLANSAKYTPEGGRIWLDVSRQDQHAILRVRDSGMGISAEMLPLIFDMFTQVDRSPMHSQGGLGIGLALVRRLVEMHGGTVEAHSAGDGLGSEFVVRLPLAAEEPNRHPANDEQSARRQSGSRSSQLRVLVVDDNQDAAEMLARLLKAMGNEVRVALDGHSALDAALAFRPHVVLLDIGLPGISGYEVARRIRQMPEIKDALLIAQTGWGQTEDKRKSAAAGFNAHLVKPVDTAALRALLAGLPPRVE